MRVSGDVVEIQRLEIGQQRRVKGFRVVFVMGHGWLDRLGSSLVHGRDCRFGSGRASRHAIQQRVQLVFQRALVQGRSRLRLFGRDRLRRLRNGIGGKVLVEGAAEVDILHRSFIGSRLVVYIGSSNRLGFVSRHGLGLVGRFLESRLFCGMLESRLVDGFAILLVDSAERVIQLDNVVVDRLRDRFGFNRTGGEIHVHVGHGAIEIGGEIVVGRALPCDRRSFGGDGIVTASGRFGVLRRDAEVFCRHVVECAFVRHRLLVSGVFGFRLDISLVLGDLLDLVLDAEIFVQRGGDVLVHGGIEIETIAGGSFDRCGRGGIPLHLRRLRLYLRLDGRRRSDGFVIEPGKLAHQFLFEVYAKGVIHRLGGNGLDRRLRANRLARIETHDTGQFRKGIVIGYAMMIGDFQLVSVCHNRSRTRTRPRASDV
ncbi:MAG: hypothetical protein ACTHNH_03385, partial [Mesorhizobium sp.]